MFNTRTLHRHQGPPRRLFSQKSFFFNVHKEKETLYQVLKVKTTAPQKEIKLAYYKLAKLHHPDFQTDSTEAQKEESEEQFKHILKAYEVLSNPISRQAYDIENRINEGVNLEASSYEDSLSKRSYF